VVRFSNLAIAAARGLPILLYRRLVPRQQLLPGALLHSTTVSFIVVATNIGVDLGTISAGTAAAFVASGLLTVILFPPVSAMLLRQCMQPGVSATVAVEAVRAT